MKRWIGREGCGRELLKKKKRGVTKMTTYDLFLSILKNVKKIKGGTLQSLQYKMEPWRPSEKAKGFGGNLP